MNKNDKYYWILLALIIAACLAVSLWIINRPIEVGKDLQVDTSAQDAEESKRLAIELIIKSEGISLTAYRDGPGCAIGYGHYGVDCDLEIDQHQADVWLIQDIDFADSVIDQHVSVPLKIGQRAALISFIYNFNDLKFKDSTLLQAVNSKDDRKVKEELERWIYAEIDGEMKVQGGLVIRRAAEIELWDR